jgi:hypothetical protein
MGISARYQIVDRDAENRSAFSLTTACPSDVASNDEANSQDGTLQTGIVRHKNAGTGIRGGFTAGLP